MKKSFINLSVIAMCLTGAVQAATTHNVAVSNGGAIDPSCGPAASSQNAGPLPVSVGLQNTQSGCRVDITAATFGGGLAVSGTAGTFPGSTSAVRIRATASEATTDLMLTPLFDVATYTGPNIIDLTANVFFSGSLDAEIAQGARFARSAAAYIRADAKIVGKSGPTIFDTSSDTETYENSVGVTNSPGNDLAFDLIGATLLPTIRHDWREPFRVSLVVTGTAGSFGSRDTKATSVFESVNTLSFSKTGPAFIVPDLFTVNAPDLNIFNNRWIDPRVTVAAVPLPAGLPLLFVGVGVLGLLRRKTVNR